MKYINQDLLASDVDYIVQQCNCLTLHGRGLAQSISQAFPFANVYGRRVAQTPNLATPATRDVPGTFRIMSRDLNVAPHVLCLFGQWRPGSVTDSAMKRYPEYDLARETVDQRIEWFKKSLHDAAEHILATRTARREKVRFGFPFRIGCGLAGGHWPTYVKLLEEFEQRFHADIAVEIYVP